MNYQIISLENCLSLIKNNKYGIIAFNSCDYPYAIPVNYKIECEDDNYFLIIKSYYYGKKYELIKKNTKVSVLIIINNNCYTNSIIINGKIVLNPNNLSSDYPNDLVIKIDSISGRKVQVT